MSLTDRVRRIATFGFVTATMAILLVPAGGLEAKIVDRIVALVNLDVITQGDLDRMLNEQIQALRVYQNKTYDEARQIAEADAPARLEDLIASTLLDQEARRQERDKTEYVISQIALDEEIKSFRQEQGLKDEAAFAKALSAQNYTQATFRREMLKSLRIKELLKRDVVPRIHVTDAETIAFYNEHHDEYPDKDAARDVLRERRFGEEREKYIRTLRERAMVKTLVQF